MKQIIVTASQLGADWLKNLARFDLIVRTPGMHPKLILKANPDTPNILEKVTGNIDLFFENSPSQNIIGVTGTKGKGTTSFTVTQKVGPAAANKCKVVKGKKDVLIVSTGKFVSGTGVALASFKGTTYTESLSVTSATTTYLNPGSKIVFK